MSGHFIKQRRSLMALIIMNEGSNLRPINSSPMLDLPYLEIGLTVLLIIFVARGGRRSALDKELGRQESSAEKSARVLYYLTILGLVSFVAFRFYSAQQEVEKQRDSSETVESMRAAESQEKARVEGATLRTEASDLLEQAAETKDLKKRDELLEQAIEKAEASISLSKEKSAFLTRALALARLKRYEEMQEAFSQYVSMDGQDRTLVVLLLEQGENERALAEIEKLLKARKPCKTMLLKTEILLNLERYDEASAVFQTLHSCREEKKYDVLDKRFKAWIEKRDI